MSMRYKGGVISATAPTTSTSAAKGVWTLPQQLQALAAGNWPLPPPSVIGQAFGGGFYAGQIGVGGVATHYIIVGPVASAQNSSIQYKNANTLATGADSFIDGPQNTADLVAGGSSTVYPAAHFCNDLVIGGFSDWYMPARNELEVCYYNLKPTTTSNNTGAGTNTNAVPSRGSNYTTSDPAQTSATDFKDTGTEDFSAVIYWSSTEHPVALFAFGQIFNTGYQANYGKNGSYHVRAIRRIAA